jgi:hypothetical protein
MAELGRTALYTSAHTLVSTFHDFKTLLHDPSEMRFGFRLLVGMDRDVTSQAAQLQPDCALWIYLEQW